MVVIQTVTGKTWMDKGVPCHGSEVNILWDYQGMTDQQRAEISQTLIDIWTAQENAMRTMQNAPTGEFKTADKVAPAKTLSSIDRARVLTTGEDGAIMCSICGATCEEKQGRNGKSYAYCPNCRDNRTMKGTPFPPKVK